MQRPFWIIFGVGAQLLFVATVWKLFWYLKGSPTTVEQGSLWIDALLALQFAIPHSTLLLPNVRKSLERWIPSPLYGSFFCVVTCTTLLLAIGGWQTNSSAVWQFTAVPRMIMQALFLGAWVALIYSLSLTGLGYQTGWTTWFLWLRGKPIPRRRFEPRGVYRFLRHPVYLSFLGLIWFTPDMTLDRAVLAGIWSVYIFVGSHLKDRRLTYYIGDMYLGYQAQVPGYPLMPLGPLARVPKASTPVHDRLVVVGVGQS
jgi:hypothetical protein